MLLMFFPDRHVPVLFGALSAPTMVTMWLSPPLYSAMLNGQDIAAADFKWVNTGLGISSALTSIFVVAIFVMGRRKITKSAL